MLNDAPFMAVAGIWREQQGNRPPAFTMLTTAPGADCVHTTERRGFTWKSPKANSCNHSGRFAERRNGAGWEGVVTAKANAPQTLSADVKGADLALAGLFGLCHYR
jgi:hypothetical protein